jgi:TPP-dependent pyruvate/acetoin dehydrogenase alpha subunit
MSTSFDPAPGAGALPEQLLRALYVEMARIRKAEEAVVSLYPQQEIRCPTHLSIGQEAIAVGVCQTLREEDIVLSGHRCHAHYLAKGGSLKAMFAELYGKATGCCRGKGGSMHLASPETGMLGASAIVAGTVPIAVGAALAASLRGSDEIAVAFFGDAAVEQGVTHESLNFSALRRLPVLFVCENNLYATLSPLSVRQPNPDISQRAGAHSIPAVCVDGNDVVEVFAAARAAVERARRGEGPTFMEARTYRWREHVGPNFDTELGHRTRAELDSWMARDPLDIHARRLEACGVLTEEAREAVDAAIATEVSEAVRFAKSSPFPEPAALYSDVE